VDRARRLLADAHTRAGIARQRLTRLRQLHTQIGELTTHITRLVQRFDTALTQIRGIAAVAEAELLAEVGDISRYATKAQFAMSNGTAPLPAALDVPTATGATAAATGSSTGSCTTSP
jgi:transposase